MSGTDPLSPLQGTPAYAVEVGWTDQDILANQEVSLYLRHMYLRLFEQLPAVIGDADNPADPGPPAVENFPASPQHTITDIFNGTGGDLSDMEDLLNDLLLVVSGNIAVGVEGQAENEFEEASPPMVQESSNLLLHMQMAGIISGVNDAVSPPTVIMNDTSADALERWRDLPNAQNVLNEAVNAGVSARVRNRSELDQFASTSLQHLIRFEYVQRGNEVMFDSMAELHDSLVLIEDTLGLLNRVGDILNQKSPEEAKLDIESLVQLNRNALEYSVDALDPPQNARSYAAALDAWESRQFNRELGTYTLDLGSESDGFLESYNRNFGLIPETETAFSSPGSLGGVGNGVSTQFAGLLQQVPVHGFTLTDGITRFIIDPAADISAGGVVDLISFVDGGTADVQLFGNGSLDLSTGAYVVNFFDPPPNGAQIQVSHQYPSTKTQTGEIVASGDGTQTAFTGRTEVFPVINDSLRISDGFEVFTISGGVLVGDQGGSGTINTTTGEYSVTFANAPALGVDNIRASYDYNVSLSERVIGTGNGLTSVFSGRLLPDNITPGSVFISDGQTGFVDDGFGNLTANDASGGTGTINYQTGQYSINFMRNVDDGTEITANWTHPPSEPVRLTAETVTNEGSGNQFVGSLEQFPVLRSTQAGQNVVVSIAGETYTDNGSGILEGSFGGVGTIDYATGQITMTSTLIGPGSNASADYTFFNGVPDTDAQLLTHLGAQITSLVNSLPEGDLKDALRKIEEDLLGQNFTPDLANPEFNINVYIADFREGAEGDYQRNLNAAIVAAQSLNDTEKEELRRRMFEFEEFYKSASAVIAKITQILERIAQGIAR